MGQRRTSDSVPYTFGDLIAQLITIMGTYSKENFEQIASAVRKDVSEICQNKNDFEAAALMYRLDLDLPERQKPSEQRNWLIRVGHTARKLLRLLGVADSSQAPDGPARKALQVLASIGHKTEEDLVIRAVARVGRLVEILDAVDALREIERRAATGAKEAVEIGKLYVPKGHQGDVAVNDWIVCMLGIYQKITGKSSGISVKASHQRDRGKPTGPLIHFLQAAGEPLGISLSAASLAGRVKDFRTGVRRAKK
jgi:hypothetical protein